MERVFTSRKFLLTLLFSVIFVANYVFKLAIPWEALLALATIFGIYSVANAYESASNNPSYRVDYSEQAFQPYNPDPAEKCECEDA